VQTHDRARRRTDTAASRAADIDGAIANRQNSGDEYDAADHSWRAERRGYSLPGGGRARRRSISARTLIDAVYASL
jgi:hypothetical protein